MVKKFLDKKVYSILRRTVPSIKKQHHLDSLVGPYGHWESLQKFQLQFLVKQGLMKNHTLLDIGCGPLQGGLAYIDYLNSGSYVGIDLSQEALDTAYAQIAEAKLAHKNPKLVYSSTFGKNELGGQKFDFMWASQILYHLSPETLDQLFEQISSRMTPNALFFGDIIGNHPRRETIETQGYWRQFPFYLHSIDNIQRIGDKHSLLVEPLDIIGNFGYPQKLNLHTNIMLKISKKDT